jgi:adenylate kinase family enzyme
MKKVIIIGCPGSGKSTFARTLREKTGLPLYYLDQMYWNSDRTHVDQDLFHVKLQAALQQEEWIIDGNFASTMEWRLSACDTVFFLDYSLEVCLSGIDARRGKSRPDMPWIGLEDDESFISFIRKYNEESRPQVLALLARYPDKQLIVFRNRDEAAAFLENL